MSLFVDHDPPIGLRAQFGDYLRLGWEAGGTTRSAWPVEERLWLLEVRCKYGIICPYGSGVLAAFTDHPRVGSRLRRLPFLRAACGDSEILVTFDARNVAGILAVLKPYRRRRLSDANRARNAETLARIRPKRRQRLFQNDFRAPESTALPGWDLRCPERSGNVSPAAEVLPGQEAPAPAAVRASPQHGATR